MAKKNKKRYSSAENKAYRRGFFAGLFSIKKKKTGASNKKAVTVKKSKKTRTLTKAELAEEAKWARKNGIGAIYRNGKYWDTNFKEPKEISKKDIEDMREEYFGGSDEQVANRYVLHMRRKYGVFDKNDNFLHLLSEEPD